MFRIHNLVTVAVASSDKTGLHQGRFVPMRDCLRLSSLAVGRNTVMRYWRIKCWFGTACLFVFIVWDFCWNTLKFTSAHILKIVSLVITPVMRLTATWHLWYHPCLTSAHYPCTSLTEFLSRDVVQLYYKNHYHYLIIWRSHFELTIKTVHFLHVIQLCSIAFELKDKPPTFKFTRAYYSWS